MVGVLFSVLARYGRFPRLYIYFFISNIFDFYIAWINVLLYPKNTILKLHNPIL